MSFSTSCCWRLIVFVETTTLSPFLMAQATAGSRYARDFPTPVPASAAQISSPLKALHTARSMSTWLGRSSKSGYNLLSAPWGERPAASSSSSSGWISCASTGSATTYTSSRPLSTIKKPDALVSQPGGNGEVRAARGRVPPDGWLWMMTSPSARCGVREQGRTPRCRAPPP